MERNAKDAKPNDALQGATEGPHVSYVPQNDATPEGELSALAAVFKFILDRHERKKDAGTESGGDGGEEAAERDGIGGIVSEERP